MILYRSGYFLVLILNHLSANPTKWSNTLKQFVVCCQRIVWVWFTILWVGAQRINETFNVLPILKLKNRKTSFRKSFLVSCLNFEIFISLLCKIAFNWISKSPVLLRWFYQAYLYPHSIMFHVCSHLAKVLQFHFVISFTLLW